MFKDDAQLFKQFQDKGLFPPLADGHNVWDDV